MIACVYDFLSVGSANQAMLVINGGRVQLGPHVKVSDSFGCILSYDTLVQ